MAGCACCTSAKCGCTSYPSSFHVTLSGTGACGYNGTYLLLQQGGTSSSQYLWQNLSAFGNQLSKITFQCTVASAGTCFDMACNVFCASSPSVAVLAVGGGSGINWTSCNCSSGSWVSPSTLGNTPGQCGCTITAGSITVSP